MQFRISLQILSVLLIALPARGQRFDCANSASVDRVLAHIKETYETADVTDYVDYVLYCDKSKPPRLSAKQATAYTQVSRAIEAKFLLEEAAAAARYRNVDIELDIYREKLKGTKAEVRELEISRLKKVAARSADRGSKNCSPVDLRSKFGPVRDQDSVGWCYAFVAADLLSARLGFRVSAADIAVHYTADKNLKPFPRTSHQIGELGSGIEGGSPHYALLTAMKNGVCREADSPSEFYAEDSQLRNSITDLETKAAKSWPRYLLNQTSRLTEDKICPTRLSSASQIESVVRLSLPSNVIYNLNAARCAGKRIPAGISELDSTLADPNGAKVVEFLDRALSLGQPAIVGYHSNFLKGLRGDSPHASVVVGRRINPASGLCEFLIRNTWGPSCAPYGIKFDCEEGHVWVPREKIDQFAIDAVSIEK